MEVVRRSVTEGTVEERAKAAIAKTESFFNSLDILTRLSDYTDQYAGTAEKVSETLRERGWVALGEHKAVTPEAVKVIVEGSY